MQHGILDYKQPEKRQHQRYVYLAFGFAMLNLVLLVVSIVQKPYMAELTDVFYLPFFTRFIFIVVFSCSIGISASALSFLRKERNTFLKWFSLFVNSAFFLLLFATIYYLKSLNG
ncbi:MAG: hypothetical protein AAGI49_12135 [Bacteroidota bacterium]